MRRTVFVSMGLLLAGTLEARGAAPTPASVLPRPQPVFTGRIARSVSESKPDYPVQARAPKGAPNILLVMTDDEGFGASSTFGGEIPTPNLDRLAAQGLRYNRFHTSAMCSPTRAALLTGRNPHNVGTGSLTDMSSGFPGYTGIIPRSAASIARILRDNGYSTAMFGKHHNVTRAGTSQAGPFDQWPSALGFDYFYGFIGGNANQFFPKLYRGTQPADPRPVSDYIFDRDLAEDAIRWLHNQKAASQDEPFFIYYAPGSPHGPLQAPKEWIARFRGKFDQGWDQVREQIFIRQKALGIIPADALLNPRPKDVPAWDSLTRRQQQVYARMMEVYAAQLAHFDAQFGRVVDELQRMGELEDTLIVYISGDNGATGEGGLEGNLNEMGHMANGVRETADEMFPHLEELGGPTTSMGYPVGWAMAMNTPFQWSKRFASHLGGTRNGLVVTWPRRIGPRREVLTQFHHVIDIFPTLLEVAGIALPTAVDGVPQQPVDGMSLAYTFDDPTAPDLRRSQYFELLGNRALYEDGWMANTRPRRLDYASEPPPGEYEWELYDLRTDFSQARNLAAEQPERLRAMQERWWALAERNNVLPIDDNPSSAARAATREGIRPGRYDYWGSDISIHADKAPFLAMRSFSVTARVRVSRQGADGVLLASGSRFGGWSFYLKDGKPVALHAYSHKPEHRYRIAAHAEVPSGEAVVRYEFVSDGGGRYSGGAMRISIDGKQVASGRIEKTILLIAPVGETFDIGRDTGLTVHSELEGDGAFTGQLDKVELELAPMNEMTQGGGKT